MNKKKKVVVIGGGNGAAITLRALKRNLQVFDISSVISMSDSGGSTGRLRKEFNTLPPGDILRAALALSKYDYLMLRKIFNKTRFDDKTGKLSGHNLGNLFLVLAEKYDGDFVKALRALEQAVESVGKAYPVTTDVTDLVVELENGDVVKTEGIIDRPDYDRSLKIKRAWLEPKANIYDEAKEQIEQADYIVLSPGSLYCSIIATLLPNGVKEAIEKSKAKIIYIAGNGYELAGETGPERLSDFVKQLQSYLPRKVDLVIYNNHALSNNQKEKYEEKGWGIIEFDEENLKEYNVKTCDYEADNGGLEASKLAEILKEVIN